MSSKSQYTAIHLASRPESTIVPGETFIAKTHALRQPSELNDGEVILKTIYLSLDPAMRGWIDDKPSYLPPVGMGEIMRGYAIGIVTFSKSPQFLVGSYAMGYLGWTEEAVMHESKLESVPALKEDGRLAAHLGVFGITGITAYLGIVDVGRVQAGDCVVVSGAAGATGSVAGQIAKIHDATVYGITGSDEKCRWLTEELGFDGALNYKDARFEEEFRALFEGRIDVFYDNVGGEVLDLALVCAKKFARFVMCGGVSQFNEPIVKGPSNYQMIWRSRIRMEGFIVTDHAEKYPEIRKILSDWMAAGRLKGRETIIQGGLLQAERVLTQLYSGINTGKLLLDLRP